MRTPWVQKRSLWAMGTPVMAAAWPAAIRLSAASAWARASSSLKVIKLLYW